MAVATNSPIELTHIPGTPYVIAVFDFDGCTADTELPAMRVAIETLIEVFGEDLLREELAPQVKTLPQADQRGALVEALVQHWGGVPFPEMLERCERESRVALDEDTYPRAKVIDDNFGKTAEALEKVDAVRGMVELAAALEWLEQNSDITVVRLVITSSPLERVAQLLENIGAAKYFRPRPGLLVSATALRHRMAQAKTSTPDLPFPLNALIFSAEAERVPSKSYERPDIILKGIQAAAEYLGVDLQDALQHAFEMEDSPSGMSGATGAGVRCRIGWTAGGHISDPAGQASRLRDKRAHVIAGEPDELYAAVSDAISTFVGQRIEIGPIAARFAAEFAQATPAAGVSAAIA